MATTNKVQIDVTADTAQAVSGLGAVKRELTAAGSNAGALEGFAKGAGSSLDDMGQARLRRTPGLSKTSAGAKGVSEQLSLAGKQIQAFIAAQLGLSVVKDVAQTADAYQNLQARIKLATGEGAAFDAAFSEVAKTAERTSSNLEATGNLFAKIAEAGKSSGLSAQAAIAQSLKLTETVNQAIQLSGGSAASAAAGIQQLIQGFQSGVLRGDEFNSVMENSPRLAKALADGLGVTTGELRKMAEAGQLSADTVIGALQGQSEILQKEFATLPATIGRAVENLSTSWTLYVGEVDKASGASSVAASAISLLANNLSTVGGLLIDAGQAAAGFTAFKLAQTFLGIGAASAQAATGVASNTVAMGANTTAHQTNTAAVARESLAFKALAADVAAQAAALGGNTVATAANTAAKNAAGAAADTAAAGVGRFAAILSTLKTFTLIGLLTNIKDIGTALGEGAAKLVGYKDGAEALAQAERQAADAGAAAQAARERGVALLQAATDKQFALSKASALSIAEFDKLTKAGDTAAEEAVAKIGKDFNFGNQAGIRDATAALDKLAADGKLSAAEFEGAWSNALKSVDLSVFEVQARAALSGAAREAERLAQVMDGTLREAVRRTGLDFDVIKGGMSKASASALSDTEVIIQGLDRLKAQGVDTGQALTASIGNSIKTADTEKAIELARQQIESLRKQLGDKVTDGLLDQATQKAEQLKRALEAAKPGIDSLGEALRELGVKSDAELGKAAESAKNLYEAVQANGGSAREAAEAFRVYADAATKANGGVIPDAIRLQAEIKGVEIGLGKAGAAGRQAGADISQGLQQTAEEAAKVAEQIDSINAKYGQSKADRDGKFNRPGEGKSNSVLTKDNLAPVDNTGLSSLQAERRNGTLSGDDLKTAQAVFDAASANKDVFDKNATAFSSEGARSIFESLNSARSLLDEVKGLANKPLTRSSQQTSQSNQTVTVKIDLGNGRTRDVNVASANDANALIQSLKDARLAA